jgi:hypothetical protein
MAVVRKQTDPKPPRGTADKLAVGLLLRGETVTAKLLGERAGISAANALKCIKRVQLFLGEHVEHDSESRNSYAMKLRSTTGLPQAAPNRSRALTGLCIARSLMAPFRGTALDSEIRKMVESLLATDSGRADDLSRRIRGRARALAPGAAGQGVIDTVTTGLLESKRLTCGYTTTRGQTLVLDLEPLTLLLDEIGVHLYANCVSSTPDSPRVGSRMTYALPRMKDVALGPPFSYPTGHEFNAEELFGPAFGLNVPRQTEDATVQEVVLRFDSGWRSYLSGHPIHATQVVEPAVADGGTCLLVRLRVYVTYDLVHWIRGHGASVQVVQPPSLQRWIDSGAGPLGPPDTAPNDL